MDLINGVVTKKLKVIPDERGRLMEIMRSDDPFFEKFGQVYLSTTYPGVVKAWHYHSKQSDNIATVKGMIKLALYDAREDSSTFGKINEFFIGEHNPMLVHVPPGVYHGWKCISESEALVINIPDHVYVYDAPDEFRIDPHNNDIPYNWARKDG